MKWNTMYKPEDIIICKPTDIIRYEPERYIEEKLRDIMIYAGQENISRERVCELLQKVKEQ